MPQVNRRAVLLGGLAAAGAAVIPAVLPSWANARTTAAAPVIHDPFQLGIASGDPLPDSVVLWTRLAPAPLNPDGFGGMPDATYAVDWELADDQAFTSIVQRGTASAVRASAHSVHIEPRGLLPGREYFYRFKTSGYLSPVGRTRTAPAAGASVDQLKYCFTSCQHWEEGWYHSYKGVVADDPDLVLFLGDYIYEKKSGRVKAELNPRRLAVADEANSLALYRARHGQHKTDADLQAAHALAPWMIVFDDHEVMNNWNGTTSPAPAARKAAGFQAFYEHMPIRSTARPNGSSIQLYRQFNWGALARFHLLDTRQYRSAQVPDPSGAAGPACGPMRDPARSIMGTTQEAWLLKAFETHPATWDFLGQQVFFAQRDGDGNRATCESNDSWQGYEASRDRIAKGWVDRKVPNPVVLTGDVHRHWAADLRQDYFDHSDPIIGSELVTTSVTSNSDGAADPSAAWYANNPHVKYCRGKRGYVRVTTSQAQLRAAFVTVSDTSQADLSKVTIATDRSYVVQAGKPGLHQV
ncbi:alkaline phosphatase D family protein [Amycolatopsis sp. H20-H5]|uniref:alkaline phosphatase D family protein n=1 Tax=Amycolatopsis sp. H20-H5 TaxID=3046309 RepID=UPI002DBF9BC8|nr:alkaline phosphatase D family protein [Amycolatopsis sp. H20-H5]MEC3977630.1 alkaline phosphatase D family protein [Amycolatopsis sp. H20-H5]